MADFYYFFCKF